MNLASISSLLLLIAISMNAGAQQSPANISDLKINQFSHSDVPSKYGTEFITTQDLTVGGQFFLGTDAADWGPGIFAGSELVKLLQQPVACSLLNEPGNTTKASFNLEHPAKSIAAGVKMYVWHIETMSYKGFSARPVTRIHFQFQGGYSNWLRGPTIECVGVDSKTPISNIENLLGRAIVRTKARSSSLCLGNRDLMGGLCFH
jgi:hypothetical protein